MQSECSNCGDSECALKNGKCAECTAIKPIVFDLTDGPTEEPLVPTGIEAIILVAAHDIAQIRPPVRPQPLVTHVPLRTLQCTICNKFKSPSAFSPKRRQCKPCTNERNRELRRQAQFIKAQRRKNDDVCI